MYFKVVKSGTNRKLVYDFLLVDYIVTFALSRTVLEKFYVKQSNDLEICARSLTVASRKGCRVAMYVKYSEHSERKKRTSPFSTTTVLFDAPPQGTPANICINLILPETTPGDSVTIGVFYLSHPVQWVYISTQALLYAATILDAFSDTLCNRWPAAVVC